MVIKQQKEKNQKKDKFESSVISYGNQTKKNAWHATSLFESSVISYGNQTLVSESVNCVQFESSVISYGNQTNPPLLILSRRLRVV